MGHQIISVKTFCLKLASSDPYLGPAPSGAAGSAYFVRPPWRSLYSRNYETLVVRLESDDGAVGWGEALAPVAPEVPQAAIDRVLAPQLLGADPTTPRPVSARLAGLMRERGHLAGHQADALAACDIALWDLAGQIAGLPVAQMLGGTFRSVIPAYVSGLPRATDGERAELAREWIRQGFSRVKLALGHGVEQDLATFDAIATACPELAIGVDAHWAYTLADAERLGLALDTRHAWFLEAPLAPEDTEGHRSLAERIVTPVAIGETLRNRFEFGHWLGRRALDLCQPDIARMGITEALAAATLSDAAHVRVAPHHSVGLGIALAAGLQFAAAIENLEIFEFQPTTLPHANRILASPIQLQGGSFLLPDGPGLGVVLEEQAINDLSETA